MHEVAKVDGDKMETVTDFIFFSSNITMDRDIEKEELLENIIRAGDDRMGEEALSFLNNNDGEEGDYDGSGALIDKLFELLDLR